MRPPPPRLRPISSQTRLGHLDLSAFLIATLLLFAGSACAADGGVSSAWDALWSNRLSEARNQFERDVAASPRDPAPRRGLILAQWASGYERKAVDSTIELLQLKQAEPLDLLLARWIYQEIPTHYKDEERFLKGLQAMLKNVSFDPLDRRSLLGLIGTFALSNSNAELAGEIAENLNRVDAWSILGPFDNTSGSGHRRNHLEEKEEFWQSYAGKAGQRFRWHDLEITSRLRRVDFDNHFERANGSTVYAGTVIKTKRAGRYLLSVGKNGAIVLWLNGTELLHSDEVSLQDDYHHFEVDLERGRNTLLARVSTRESAPRILASLCEPNGKRPADTTFEPLTSGQLVRTKTSFRYRPLPLAAAQMARAAANPGDPEATFWHLASLLLFGLREDGRSAALAAEERFDDSGLMMVMIARALLADGDEDGWRNRMKAAREADPNNALAGLWHARELLRQDRLSDAVVELRSLGRAPREFPSADIALLALYQERQMVQEAFDLAEEMLDRFPDYHHPYTVLADHYQSIDPSRSKEMREKALDRAFRTAGLVDDYLQAIDEKDADDLVAVLESMSDLYPDSPQIQTELVRAKWFQGDRRALKRTRELAKLFPYRHDVQLLRAEIAEHLIPALPEEKEEAIRYYQRALALYPVDFTIRDKLRRLQGEVPVSEILPPLDLVTPRSGAPDRGDYPGADACVVLDERRRVLFQEGPTSLERALLVKIFTPEGAEAFGSVRTGVNPLFSELTIRSARTIKPDGSSVEALTAGGSVAFPSLSPGDLLELHFHSMTWSVGTLARQFWDVHGFQWNLPCKRSSYSLLTPPGMVVRWKVRNRHDASDMYRSRKHGDLTLQTWKLEDIPARRPEVYAPNARDVTPWLDVSTIYDWADIVAWYRDLSELPSTPHPRVEEKVTAILGEDRARADATARLYDFVANRIAYEDLDFQYSAYVPEPAPDVLRAGYGDCKDKVCLLRAMVGAIGEESYFALVSPVTQGVHAYLPSVRFTHAILALPSGDGYTFIDPTARGMPFGEVPEVLQGAHALVVRPGVSELTVIPVPESDLAARSVTSNIRIESKRDLLVSRHECYRKGDDVAFFRSAFRGKEPHEQRRLLSTDLGRTSVGVELLNLEWEGLDSTADSLGLRYEMRLGGAVSRSGTLGLLKVPWRSDIGEDFSAIVASPERSEPLMLYGLRLFEEETAWIELPRGWTVQGLPEPRTIDTPYGSLLVLYERSGGSIVARRRLQIRGTRVPPEDYAGFKSFLEQALREQDQFVVLTS